MNARHARWTHRASLVFLLGLTACRDRCSADTSPNDAAARADIATPRPPARGPWRSAVMPVFVQGPLDGRAVETFLRSHRRDIDACAIDPPAADIDRVRVMLRVSIGGDGRVADVQPLQPRPESQQYRECVTNALRAWTFPRSDASASTVLIALEFTPEAL